MIKYYSITERGKKIPLDKEEPKKFITILKPAVRDYLCWKSKQEKTSRAYVVRKALIDYISTDNLYIGKNFITPEDLEDAYLDNTKTYLP